jgi:hypothetical protein
VIRFNIDGYTINSTYTVTYKWDQVAQSGFTWACFDNKAQVATVAPMFRALGLRKSVRASSLLAMPGTDKAFACLERSLHLRAFACLRFSSVMIYSSCFKRTEWGRRFAFSPTRRASSTWWAGPEVFSGDGRDAALARLRWSRGGFWNVTVERWCFTVGLLGSRGVSPGL